MTLRGSCLCGAVRYRIDRLDGAIEHCHCRTCQKAHASACATTARVEREHFRWEAVGDAVLGYESSPGKVRRFCGRCGTPLVAERAGRPYVSLRVATLDEDPGLRPAMHIWVSHDLPWLGDEGALPRNPEWPQGR